MKNEVIVPKNERFRAASVLTKMYLNVSLDIFPDQSRSSLRFSRIFLRDTRFVLVYQS